MLDYQDSIEIRQEVMEDGDEKMTAYEDFFSSLNKEGGWLNLGCVTIGIGALTFAMAFFGFCGVHERSACLLFTYIILIIIGICEGQSSYVTDITLLRAAQECVNKVVIITITQILM